MSNKVQMIVEKVSGLIEVIYERLPYFMKRTFQPF